MSKLGRMNISPETTKVHIPQIELRHRLRIAREFAGLDQSDIADELGIGRVAISNYERGVTEPKKLVINAWAVVTDVDVEWIKTGELPNLRPTDYKVGASINFPSLKKAS